MSEISRRGLSGKLGGGESVGVLAAQAIGQPATQMTLDTFHRAGLDIARGNIGVSRMKELLDCAKCIKCPSLQMIHRSVVSQRFAYWRLRCLLARALFYEVALVVHVWIEASLIADTLCFDKHLSELYVVEQNLRTNLNAISAVMRTEVDIGRCDTMSLTSRSVACVFENTYSGIGGCDVMYTPLC